jgi:hypothetical protein
MHHGGEVVDRRGMFSEGGVDALVPKPRNKK